MSDEPALVTRRTMETVTAVATAGIGALVMWGAYEHDIGWGDSGPGSGYFPFRIGVLLVLASLANLISALRRRAADDPPFVTAAQMRNVVSFALPMVGFVFLSVFLGLYVATVLYLAGVMVFQGGYKPLFSLALALGVAIAMRLIFPMWFKVPLLTGPLEAMLGLY